MFLFLINSYVDSDYKSISFYCYGLALHPEKNLNRGTQGSTTALPMHVMEILANYS